MGQEKQHKSIFRAKGFYCTQNLFNSPLFVDMNISMHIRKWVPAQQQGFYGESVWFKGLNLWPDLHEFIVKNKNPN